ncbi:hypothetical protein WMO40_13315 [Bacillaceae bacterium CLA-AA-H227]|uniref:Uncharacterized protein n=2 Tax=Robertmurraya TaxID=2837507 RepID=A0A4V5P3Q7_9BACI|nr:hypothetical protein [Robertmurraya kyonggiensis]TKC15000.1 hypothetical protein FA727_19065 [Robertmurraya kyonggiensis]
MSELSNFEKGIVQYLDVIKSPTIDQRHSPTTRKLNEAVCLMASEDMELMKKIVMNRWVINRALSSAFARKCNI